MPMYVRPRNPYVHWIIGSLVFLVVMVLLYSLRTILTPFIAAAILAYILILAFFIEYDPALQIPSM